MRASNAERAAAALADSSSLDDGRLGGTTGNRHKPQSFSRQPDARALTKALGGSWHGRYGMVRCPCHKDRTPSVLIKDDARKRDGIDVHDFAGCDWRDVKAALHRQGLLPSFKSEAPRFARTAEATPAGAISPTEIDAEAEQRRESAIKLWEASTALRDTLGWKYFTQRRQLHIGLLDDLSHCLRWHEGIKAVVALMTDPVSGAPTGVHRTFLDRDGTKRERKMLGKRGVVRLSPDEEVTLGLGIAEGVEDAMAVLLLGRAPVWAASCAGAIDRFPVLPGVEHLTIFADDDEVGIKAAQTCAERWQTAGHEARIVLPKDLSDDR